MTPVMPVMPAAATAIAAAVARATLFGGRRALGFTNRRFAGLLAARRFLVAMLTMAEQLAAATMPASAKQAGVGLRLQASDDDTHRRQAQRQANHLSFHRSTSKNKRDSKTTLTERNTRPSGGAEDARPDSKTVASTPPPRNRNTVAPRAWAGMLAVAHPPWVQVSPQLATSVSQHSPCRSCPLRKMGFRPIVCGSHFYPRSRDHTARSFINERANLFYAGSAMRWKSMRKILLSSQSPQRSVSDPVI